MFRILNKGGAGARCLYSSPPVVRSPGRVLTACVRVSSLGLARRWRKTGSSGNANQHLLASVLTHTSTRGRFNSGLLHMCVLRFFPFSWSSFCLLLLLLLAFCFFFFLTVEIAAIVFLPGVLIFLSLTRSTQGSVSTAELFDFLVFFTLFSELEALVLRGKTTGYYGFLQKSVTVDQRIF